MALVLLLLNRAIGGAGSRMRVSLISAALLSAGALLVVACSVANIPNGSEADLTADGGPRPDDAKITPKSADGGGAGGSFECTSDGGVITHEMDWHDFQSCSCSQGGKARCVPGDQLPDAARQHLGGCDNNAGRCVPDTVLDTRKLVTCFSSKSFLGLKVGNGRCVSKCVPAVIEQLSNLDRGDGNTCADDERCAPCIDPRNGKPTGLCEVDLSWKPPVVEVPADACKDGKPGPGNPTTPKADGGGTTEPAPTGKACCGGKGACTAQSSIRSDGRWILEDDDCNGSDLCVPTNKQPASCRTLIGESGFCFDECLISTLFVEQGSCASGREVCVPCTVGGMPSRLPGCPQ
jgi:hypothetical protein